MEEEEETFWQNTGKRIMAAMAFIGSTKIKVSTPFPFWYVVCGKDVCCWGVIPAAHAPAVSTNAP